MKENRLLFFWVFGLLSALILIYLTFDYQDNGGIYFIKNNQSTLFQFAAMLSQWDGGNYIQIIQNGSTIDLDTNELHITHIFILFTKILQG